MLYGAGVGAFDIAIVYGLHDHRLIGHPVRRRKLNAPNRLNLTVGGKANGDEPRWLAGQADVVDATACVALGHVQCAAGYRELNARGVAGTAQGDFGRPIRVVGDYLQGLRLGPAAGGAKGDLDGTALAHIQREGGVGAGAAGHDFEVVNAGIDVANVHGHTASAFQRQFAWLAAVANHNAAKAQGAVR